MRKALVFVVVLSLSLVVSGIAGANHSWNGYHWARTSNPFTLKLGDNVTSAWDSYLGDAANDWSVSKVLDTTVVVGGTRAKPCKATRGRIEVCNAAYGPNGWLGIAQIWVSGDHIVQGVAKMNDTYFNTGTYNTPAWRRLVMCQEIAHAFGLDHQDENFDNPNLGTCMDYTSDPDGPPSNERPNAHDYDQLELIYAHLDSTTTVESSTSSLPDAVPEWAPANDRAQSVYVTDLGGDNRLITFVFWVR